MRRLASLRNRVQPLLFELHDQLVVPRDVRGSESDATERALAYLGRPKRSVSRFWSEKAWLLLDALQIYGLVWQLAQSWPWPSAWLASTRWIVAFNLDVLSFLPTGAGMGMKAPPFSLWGELHGSYWLYALVYALLPYAAMLYYIVRARHWRVRGDALFLVFAARLENRLLRLFQVLYLPIALALSRLVNCMAVPNPLDVHASDIVLSVDPTVKCHSSLHITLGVGIGALLGLPFLFGFPWFLYRRIHCAGMACSDDGHEETVAAIELSYLVGISDDYELLYVPQYASYTRRRASLPVYMCLYKLSLLLVFSVLRSQFPNIENQPLQGTLFFTLLTLRFLLQSYDYPYRLSSTNHVMVFLDLVLIFDGVMVFLSANNVRSALTVASVKVLCLTFVHTWAIVVLSVWCVLLFLAWRRMQVTWPTHLRMRALELLHKDYASPTLVKPTVELGAMATALQAHASDALRLRHLLHRSLHDLALHVQAAYVESAATSAMPSSLLDSCVDSFASELERYQEKHAILHPRKRDALFKLRVLHTLVDEHSGKPTSKELSTPSFSAPSMRRAPLDDMLVATDPALYVWFSWDPSMSLLVATCGAPTPTLLSVRWYLALYHTTLHMGCIATVTSIDVATLWVHLDVLLCFEHAAPCVRSGWLCLRQVPSPVNATLLQCNDPDTHHIFASLPQHTPTPSAVSVARLQSLLERPIERAAERVVDWQDVLYEWEVAFVYFEKRRPSSSDRAKVQAWFRAYHSARCAAKAATTSAI
ncbi:hypothetical protein SPRG_00221 [Saprolegnia parasitica CBS 223.65]|uniref:Uncharacterized protein n=1 Tax=Saprolegnia parasitica (strain CBS 223.65) TaxID=695850 RepID=A0A067D8N6_SAPPC|nr:hypothetical protein SPRG_00221 [Saprolegnia parasitica CBS 223.65]KDO35372.1 hypothetical protein SPRG_00221 [Saprolegnia parasitica CBS 223.65]|eukprot:XP_012193717.1 hypothetical protein SPRG_00221 [Saprolegnia parasitica CBS 223.65]